MSYTNNIAFLFLLSDLKQVLYYLLGSIFHFIPVLENWK